MYSICARPASNSIFQLAGRCRCKKSVQKENKRKIHLHKCSKSEKQGFCLGITTFQVRYSLDAFRVLSDKLFLEHRHFTETKSKETNSLSSFRRLSLRPSLDDFRSSLVGVLLEILVEELSELHDLLLEVCSTGP